MKLVVQVQRISQLAIESYISTLPTSSNELLELITEDNLQKTNFFFQALADGLNLATDYNIKRTYMYFSRQYIHYIQTTDHNLSNVV